MTSTDEVQGILDDAAPHSEVSARIRVGTLASGMPVDIPLTLVRGATAGPLLWVNAGVHGHESPGSATAALFIQELRGLIADGALTGSVAVTPVANPTALNSRTKESTYDYVDLDESFPGKELLHTHRTALAISTAMFGLADVMVSVHTNGTPMHAGIYTVYKSPAVHDVPAETLYPLMAAFRPQMMCEMNPTNASEVAGALGNSIDGQHLARGVPAFMVEFGGGGVWDETLVRDALAGLRELLRRTGILDEAPAEAAPQIVVTDRKHITSPTGGFFRPTAQPGDVLPAGESAGEVVDVYGHVQHELRLPHKSVVIAMRKDPATHVGDRISFVGTAWHEVNA